MTDDDRIRGLEETIAAQAQRLAELSKLRDLAHEAKQHLIGEHARERTKRQALEDAVQVAAGVIVDMLAVLVSDPGAPPMYSVRERADAWLAAYGGRS